MYYLNTLLNRVQGQYPNNSNTSMNNVQVYLNNPNSRIKIGPKVS